MPFKQVYEHDDWGNIYYNFTRGGMASYDSRHKGFASGKFVTVKFPNRHIAKYKLVAVPYSTTVSDMGRDYGVRGERLCITENVRGIKVLIPLNKLKVLVT